MTFSVNIKEWASQRHGITNAADIYFPSVLEITPTNAVVNVIKAIAAEPKIVEATAGVPAAITLWERIPATGP